MIAVSNDNFKLGGLPTCELLRCYGAFLAAVLTEFWLSCKVYERLVITRI